MENNATEESTPKEILPAGGVSKSRRNVSGAGRFDARRSPTTGHRTRRNKTPDPQMTKESSDEIKLDASVKRSLSSPGDIRDSIQRRISLSDEDDVENEETLKQNTKKDQPKRWSNISTESGFSTDDSDVPKQILRNRSKSGENRESNLFEDKDNRSWWKSWPNWGQGARNRMKSLERDPGRTPPKTTPRKRNRSLERPPALDKIKTEEPKRTPIAKKRNKSKTRSKSQESRKLSIEDSSDDFWKSPNELRIRKVHKEKTDVEKDDFTKIETPLKEIMRIIQKEDETDKKIKFLKSSSVEKSIEETKEKSISLFSLLAESKTEWKLFIREHPDEIGKIINIRNRCVSSFVIILIYCGLGGMVFRFTEGAFESFYKCGVKRVKRDFVDALWTESHRLREDEWKSLTRGKLMEFENQLHNAYEAGMTSYSGQRAWSFINSVIYCLTVITTIGYGHISPSTTTGRAITIVYAIFGIPLFLILLADFGKLFTRGIKFVWAFVRRVYYTGSCKKVRRTGPVQEVMKGVQMVYDIATFRRPSQLPPGVEIDETLPPPLPPRVPFTPGEQPGTPAPSNFAIDDEFNLPISLAITILLIYIFCGATVFYVWEQWGFFESFYFVFISMSTIGFGDFVPQNQMYMMASIVYLVFGLALTSMCINVVQEKLSDSFRQASAKIGATIGLRIAEEDGTITPVPPIPVEVAEVHGFGFKKPPAPSPSAS